VNFEFQNVVIKILKFFGCELKITKICHQDFNLLCINYNTCYTSRFLVKSDSHLVCFALVGWEMWMWKKLNLVYKSPLLRPTSPRKGGKSGSVFILKVGCDVENWRFPWKPYSPSKSLCLRKLLSLKMP